ncbi:MAG: flippase-like domain-containing protein [Saprospiraceae bacterium]|nr:flippase-like domain-containing protein [Candidatus Opimibacter iunctus]
MKINIPRINIPGPVKSLLKLGISLAIIALILRKIDERLLLEVVREANLLWVVWAMGWFILSKIISAYRFNLLLHTEGVEMTSRQNLKLYWLCMYYNLLLPGGISGDGYKIKVLMERFSKPLKRIVTITLIDRISGLIALGQLSVILLFWIPQIQQYWYFIVPAFFFSACW